MDLHGKRMGQKTQFLWVSLWFGPIEKAHPRPSGELLLSNQALDGKTKFFFFLEKTNFYLI